MLIRLDTGNPGPRSQMPEGSRCSQPRKGRPALTRISCIGPLVNNKKDTASGKLVGSLLLHEEQTALPHLALVVLTVIGHVFPKYWREVEREIKCC